MIRTAEHTRKDAARDYDRSVEVINLIPEKVFELCANAYPNTRTKVVLSIPWHVPLEEEILTLLFDAGFVISSSDFYKTSGNRHHNLNHPDTENKSDFFSDIEIWVNSDQDGATCTKVKVGTQEVDVFDVVCVENGI